MLEYLFEMSDDEYRSKRDRNNLSVQKCRQNEKNKIETAKRDLEKYKQENKELTDKYNSLQNEYEIFKSLFSNSAGQSGYLITNPVVNGTVINSCSLNDANMTKQSSEDSQSK
jgi:archaellum component FlaC